MRTAALSLMTSAAIVAFATTATAEIPWRTNIRDAHATAQAEGKLLLLHFYSDNCVWCDRLEAGAFTAPQVEQAVAQHFVPVKVHAGTNPKLTAMFEVTKFPTDVVVTTQGKTLSHSVSPQDPNRYVAMLTKATPKGPSDPASSDASLARSQTAEAPSIASPAEANAPAAASPGETANASELSGQPAGQPQVPTESASPSQSIATIQSPVMQPASGPAVGENRTAADGRVASAGRHAAGSFAGLSLPDHFRGTAGQLASSRTNEMSLAMPGQAAASASDAAATATSVPVTPASPPELALEGCCPVSIAQEDRWVAGSPEFGVIHLGKLYLFASNEKMETFLADPMPYTPVLNGIDVVVFFEEHRIVPGKRDYGLKDPVHNRMFFFADEAAMTHFWNTHTRYTEAAIEVMEQATADANPGS